ncbi:hypothetical protein MCHI_002592 [Candidatus Magnetoovum chiemensis]|nr:hypothetical protein MCHI_002592 [Candidatus Magnetoovum chiemensis]
MEDSKLPDILKALKSAGVNVKSLVEIYKETQKVKEDNNDKG